MSKEIAVFVGANGQTADLYQPGQVIIYQRDQGNWQVAREREFFLGEHFHMGILRERMMELVEFLGPCKIFVGLTVTGIPYFSLERSGCSIWEFEGQPANFLEYIVHQEETEQRQNDTQEKISLPTPREISSGCYRISIKEIQEKNLGITSKQALLPFIRQGSYYSLEIHCNHIPPWLENEILLNQLESRTEVISRNEVTLVIMKKECNS